MRKPLIERLWARVDVKGPDDCWLWSGAVNDRDYGLITSGSRTDGSRKQVYVHRTVYEAQHGPIPAGLMVCHSCDTPRCCNTRHHFIGTNRDNMADAAAKGRTSRGSAHYNSVLTEAQVRTLRSEAYAKRGNLTRLAIEFGVSIVTANNAARGTTWKHLQ